MKWYHLLVQLSKQLSQTKLKKEKKTLEKATSDLTTLLRILLEITSYPSLYAHMLG